MCAPGSSWPVIRRRARTGRQAGPPGAPPPGESLCTATPAGCRSQRAMLHSLKSTRLSALYLARRRILALSSSTCAEGRPRVVGSIDDQRGRTHRHLCACGVSVGGERAAPPTESRPLFGPAHRLEQSSERVHLTRSRPTAPRDCFPAPGDVPAEKRGPLSPRVADLLLPETDGAKRSPPRLPGRLLTSQPC